MPIENLHVHSLSYNENADSIDIVVDAKMLKSICDENGQSYSELAGMKTSYGAYFTTGSDMSLTRHLKTMHITKNIKLWTI